MEFTGGHGEGTQTRVSLVESARKAAAGEFLDQYRTSRP